MIMNVDKVSYKKVILRAIKDFKEIEEILLERGTKSYLFINTSAGEVTIFLVNLLVYLEDKNSYYPQGFHEEFFISQVQLMHRASLSSLHIAIEAGLNVILEERNIKPGIAFKIKCKKIADKIRQKLSDYSVVAKELIEIEQLGGNHAQFSDYLNAVLNNTVLFKDLITDKKYKEETRAYFDALSIVRNKLSHYKKLLTDNEKYRLKKGHFGKMIDDGGQLEMDIQYYKPIFNDIINFFNNLEGSSMAKNKSSDPIP